MCGGAGFADIDRDVDPVAGNQPARSRHQHCNRQIVRLAASGNSTRIGLR